MLSTATLMQVRIVNHSRSSGTTWCMLLLDPSAMDGGMGPSVVYVEVLGRVFF
jgi:hypothetical protein